MIQNVNLHFFVNEDEQLVIERTARVGGSVVGYDETHLPRSNTQGLAAMIISRLVVNDTIDETMTLREFAFRQGGFRTTETFDDRTMTTEYINEEGL